MLRCTVCDEPISEDRIMVYLSVAKKLPETCIKHAPTCKPVGFVVYGHKTAGDVMFHPNPTQEQVRQMKRAYARGR
jgi:hypothetical protein